MGNKLNSQDHGNMATDVALTVFLIVRISQLCHLVGLTNFSDFIQNLMKTTDHNDKKQPMELQISSRNLVLDEYSDILMSR
ncbi:hypothetical protein HOLleu_43473 [Holothuria leucospilota]|uniref:Uncharacterized protein n=1 Tax=Holothuria leucospilota TaxID=206669 RepID=A0A9Q0YAN2_HOLLE|nr:hypothetical protein HOLleu_43473 [Holothuria leucospilota]